MFFTNMMGGLVLAFVAGVRAETHTVRFNNKCGHGTPTLVQDGNVLSTGEDFTSNGPILPLALAYLQTGSCGINGQNCTLIELTLNNPTSPGSGSSADINLIPPQAFSVPSGFSFFNGCEGAGADCSTIDCPTAARDGDTPVISCQADNHVNIEISFCD